MIQLGPPLMDLTSPPRHRHSLTSSPYCITIIYHGRVNRRSSGSVWILRPFRQLVSDHHCKRQYLTCRHPLPILNISEHQTRTRLTAPKPAKCQLPPPLSLAEADLVVIGALLGNRDNRKISIVNSFELALQSERDVDNPNPLWPINREFFETRQAQCKLIGLYETAIS